MSIAVRAASASSSSISISAFRIADFFNQRTPKVCYHPAGSTSQLKKGDAAMVVKRVAPVSVAKVAGILYALLGLCVGLLFSLVGMAGAAFASNRAESPFPFAGVMFGAGAIIFFPILYGVMGFLFSLI